MIIRLLIAGLLLASSTSADEKFLPPVLDTVVVECGVTTFPDHTANAIVVATYPTGNGFRAKLSARPDRITAAKDCQVWFHDLQEAWQKDGGK